MFFRLMILFISGMLIASCAVISGKDKETQTILSRFDSTLYRVVGKTSMMIAAENGDSRALKESFAKGDKLNAVSLAGNAFSLSLKNGHQSIARILLAAGSYWDYGFSEGGSSALIVAASKGYDDIVKMLIAKGVDLDHRDDDGFTALAKAALGGHLTTLKILISEGAVVDAYPQGRSLLMHVVEDDNMLISQILISAGVDLDFQDENGDTALRLARRKGFFDIDLMLVQAGALP